MFWLVRDTTRFVPKEVKQRSDLEGVTILLPPVDVEFCDENAINLSKIPQDR